MTILYPPSSILAYLLRRSRRALRFLLPTLRRRRGLAMRVSFRVGGGRVSSHLARVQLGRDQLDDSFLADTVVCRPSSPRLGIPIKLRVLAGVLTIFHVVVCLLLPMRADGLQGATVKIEPH